MYPLPYNIDNQLIEIERKVNMSSTNQTMSGGSDGNGDDGGWSIVGKDDGSNQVEESQTQSPGNGDEDGENGVMVDGGDSDEVKQEELEGGSVLVQQSSQRDTSVPDERPATDDTLAASNSGADASPSSTLPTPPNESSTTAGSSSGADVSSSGTLPASNNSLAKVKKGGKGPKSNEEVINPNPVMRGGFRKGGGRGKGKGRN